MKVCAKAFAVGTGQEFPIPLMFTW